MPFTTLDQIKTREKYATQLKLELSNADEGVLGKFTFYGGVVHEGKEQSFLLVGKVADVVTNALKPGAKVKGNGTFLREGSKVSLSVVTGMLPEPTVKQIFQETKNFSYKLVKGQLSAPDSKLDKPDDEQKVRAIVAPLESQFDTIKGKITDEERKALRIQFGKIADAVEATKWDEARRLAAGLQKGLDHYSTVVDPTHGKQDPRAKTNAVKRWKDAQARFDTIKGRLSDERRLTIRKLWGTAQEKLEAEDWTGTLAAVEAADEALVGVMKAMVQENEADAKGEADGLDEKNKKIDEAKKLVLKLKTQGDQLETLRLAMISEMGKVETIRKELREESAKQAPVATTIVDIKDRLEKQKGVFDKAKKALEKQRKELDETERSLREQNFLTDPGAVNRLESARERLSLLEEVLANASIHQARDELKATVKKMAEATVWREERLKKESTSADHATSRHGAQTGLERQARRAATKVAPDQGDNKSGGAKILSWNQVKFTYTEKDGKREFKERTKIATELVDRVTRAQATVAGPDHSSMWATPVLEKESHDLALTYANKLKGYKQFKNAAGNWRPFTSATFIIEKSPGWGYTVEKVGGVVSPAQAETILRSFEDGDIDLDELFKRLNTRLRSTDGGADLVPYAVVVFKRASANGNWELRTQYPDHTQTGVKWEPARYWAADSVQLRTSPTATPVTVATNALP